MTTASVRVVVTTPGARDAVEDRRCLTDDERQRADRRFAPAARARHVAGRAAVRRLLGEALGCSPAAVPLDATAHGGLVVRGHPALSVSVTHTRGLVVVAVADGARVGIDAERADRQRLPAPELWTTPDELARLSADTDAPPRPALIELWTCKEAVAKALGTGLATPLRAITVADGHVTTSSSPGGTWHLTTPAVPSTHVATLAVWEDGPTPW